MLLFSNANPISKDTVNVVLYLDSGVIPKRDLIWVAYVQIMSGKLGEN